MFAIEYFVGTPRGHYLRGLRHFASREAAQATARDELLSEIRHFAGSFMRRVVAI